MSEDLLEYYNGGEGLQQKLRISYVVLKWPKTNEDEYLQLMMLLAVELHTS